MPRLSWSRNAENDLLHVVKTPALIEQLRDNATATLHDTQDACPDDPDEGAASGIMWHRGFTHDQQRQIKEGTLEDTGSQEDRKFQELSSILSAATLVTVS